MAFGSAIHNRSSCVVRNVVITALIHGGSRAYPKWAIPTGDGSVLLEDALFDDAGIFVLPIPLMTFESK